MAEDAEARDWSSERRRSHDDLRRELVARTLHNRTDLAAHCMELPTAIYTDPVRHERERRAFRRIPILACLSGDLPQCGDKLLFDALGPEILITRNASGEVRAFLNLCPHRAARVVTECNSRSRMTCRFHGWTFDLDGRLVGLPGPEGFADMNRSGRSLIPVPVAEWHGMIFVRGDPEGEPIDVADHLGSFADELCHLELGKARMMKTTRVESSSNWKYAWDTYCESYHFATLHAATVGPRFVSNVMAMTAFGRHARMGFPRREWRELVELPESAWPANNYGGNYFIFPNINLNVSAAPNGEAFYGFYHLYPGEEVGKATTRMATYRPAHAAGAAPDSDWIRLHDFIEQVVRTEDYSVSEEGQRNLSFAPKAFRPIVGANEVLVQKWHRDWEATLEDLGRPK